MKNEWLVLGIFAILAGFIFHGVGQELYDEAQDEIAYYEAPFNVVMLPFDREMRDDYEDAKVKRDLGSTMMDLGLLVGVVGSMLLLLAFFYKDKCPKCKRPLPTDGSVRSRFGIPFNNYCPHCKDRKEVPPGPPGD